MSAPDVQEFDEFIQDISPDVFTSLQQDKFFEKLESLIFPSGTIESKKCDGSFGIAEALLAELGHDERAREDVFDVMRSKGGFCDCEIVLNATPESAVRAAYWKKRAGIETT